MIQKSPGYVIQSLLKSENISKSELQTKLELTAEETTQLLTNQYSITPKLAEKLKELFYIPASFWLRLNKHRKEGM